MPLKKEHAVWVAGASFVGFSVEGWQATAGHIVSHSIGVPHSVTAVIGAIFFGFLYSYFWEGAEKKVDHLIEEAKKKPPIQHKKTPAKSHHRAKPKHK
jgi:hypothetical protein